MNTPALSPWDAGIVVTYFLLVIVFGVWMGRRKIRNADTLFLADREATWPLIGASMFSANISSQQFVGQAGLAYSIGLVAGAFQMVGALCFVFLAVFFVDVYLSLRLRTAPEFFERRYSPGARLFVSGINVVMILAASIATALYAGATVLTSLIGGAGEAYFHFAVFAIAGAAGTYAILGGLRSVLWADLLQATLLLIGGSVTLIVSVGAAGGWGAVLAMRAADGSSPWNLVHPWDHAFGWLPLLTGAMILGVHGHCTDHDYVQRALAARSLFHSKMGAIFAAFLKVAALFIIAAPGVIAAKLLPNLAHPDQAYAQLVSTYLPVGLKGLVLASLLAAILGTVAAGLSAAASMLTFDFAGRALPGLSDRARVRLGRALMVGILLLCAVLAPGIREFKGVFVYLVQLWSLLAPPVFVCVVAGIFTTTATSRGATATLAVGSVLGAVTFWALGSAEVSNALPRYLQSPLNCGFVITLICTVVMVAVSRSGAGQLPSSIEVWRPGRTTGPGLSPREQRIYRSTLSALMIVWILVVFAFSPWGLAASRAL